MRYLVKINPRICFLFFLKVQLFYFADKKTQKALFSRDRMDKFINGSGF